jgi:transposase
MDERLRFIARLPEGEKMAPLCREFGISRVTGYNIFNRYKDCGPDALNDRSRRPVPPEYSSARISLLFAVPKPAISAARASSH